ncbi:hypothetical protein FGO68_gene7042 [Halteria grandinella]|uniref:Uncharacterized protein n=1 Tax=Halteria grandinella TaxID=5974 RepID=A0A8J8T0E9_HALGN|nr:hypothetical protein FGO68_gene7042 [Halteria grandinella]
MRNAESDSSSQVHTVASLYEQLRLFQVAHSREIQEMRTEHALQQSQADINRQNQTITSLNQTITQMEADYTYAIFELRDELRDREEAIEARDNTIREKNDKIDELNAALLSVWSGQPPVNRY